jgi:hypothetical protein
MDVGWDLSLRASFLEDTRARLFYYVFCVLCGFV